MKKMFILLVVCILLLGCIQQTTKKSKAKIGTAIKTVKIIKNIETWDKINVDYIESSPNGEVEQRDNIK